jgi:predicted transcriptional regulator
MQVITAKELRANQKKYFDLAENETIFVVRRKARPIMISVATEEEENLTRSDLLSIKKGLENIKEGRTVKINDIHKIWDNIL